MVEKLRRKLNNNWVSLIFYFFIVREHQLI